MTAVLTEHLTVTSHRELPAATECRACLELFLREHPCPAGVFESLAAGCRRPDAGAILRAGSISRTFRVRREMRQELQQLADATGLRAGLLLRYAVLREPPGEDPDARDPRTLRLRIEDGQVAYEYDGGTLRRFQAAMYERFDCGWNLGSWRVSAARTGTILSAVECLGREYFTHVETAEMEVEEASNGVGAGKPAGRKPGTAVIRPEWDDEVLVETPRRSPVFAREIKRVGGRWDGGNRCWRAPARHAAVIEALARRCYEKVEVRNGGQE